MTQGNWECHAVRVTQVGHLVARAIEELRPGFEGA
jgi:hypothetical protein